MNDHVTTSFLKVIQMFPDQESARKYLESRLWPKGPVCPMCKETKNLSPMRKGGYVRCNVCVEDFTIRTNTIFERSHVPLNKWLYAMYLLLTARKGISSIQLSKELDITQKTAWFVLQRLREACANNIETLRGIVEVDETYVGGKDKNKHSNKKPKMGRGPVSKTAVLGMRERNGQVIAKPVESTDAPTLHAEIKEHVEKGSTVMTDEWRSYNGLKGYKHKVVKHSAHEYVRGKVHTNGIESVWAVLKRGLNGVYHHASEKHLGRYVNEFTFRLNEGNVQEKTLDRMESLVRAVGGKRVTYARLTTGNA